MIKITVDLISAIHPSRNRRLGEMLIVNDGTSADLRNRGNYKVTIFRKGSTARIWRTGTVRNWPRRSCSIWLLLRAALNNILDKQT